MGIEITAEDNKIIITLTDGIETDLTEEWAYVDRDSMEIVPIALNTLMDKMEHVPINRGRGDSGRLEDIRKKICDLLKHVAYEAEYYGNNSYYEGLFTSAARACTLIGISVDEQKKIEEEGKQKGRHEKHFDEEYD